MYTTSHLFIIKYVRILPRNLPFFFFYSSTSLRKHSNKCPVAAATAPENLHADIRGKKKANKMGGGAGTGHHDVFFYTCGHHSLKKVTRFLLFMQTTNHTHDSQTYSLTLARLSPSRGIVDNTDRNKKKK